MEAEHAVEAWSCCFRVVVRWDGDAERRASWPRSADPTGRYLVDGDGKPFFWLGDTAWLLSQIPNREDAEHYLATRARQGFTVIQAAAVMGEERVGGTARPNAYGDTGVPRQRSVAALAHAGEQPECRRRVRLLGQRRLHHRPGTGPWAGRRPAALVRRLAGGRLQVSQDLQRLRLRQVPGRAVPGETEHRWILGGDNVADTDEKKTIWNAVAKGITEAVAGSEDYSKTLMTYHSPGGTSSSNWFHAAPWLDFNMIQTWSDYLSIPARIAADYKLTPPKPTGLGEGAYENGNQYKFDGQRPGDPQAGVLVVPFRRVSHLRQHRRVELQQLQGRGEGGLEARAQLARRSAPDRADEDPRLDGMVEVRAGCIDPCGRQQESWRCARSKATRSSST